MTSATELHPEAIIERMGARGRFQILLVVILHSMKIVVAFTIFTMPFTVAVPKWQCNDSIGGNISQANDWSNSYHVTTEGQTGTPSKLFAYSTNSGSTPAGPPSLNQFDANGTSGGIANRCRKEDGTICENILYDSSMKTIVSEWNMACELSWVPSLTASMQMVGLLFGNVASGQLADIIGRKKPLFIALTVMIVANVICCVSNSWPVFSVGRVLAGIGMGCFLTIQYSLPTEVTLSRLRPWVIFVPSWHIEACLLALVAFLLPDWRKLHIVTALIGLPFYAAWWFIPESFRWYLSHDRKDDAKKVIQYISKFNKRPMSDEVTVKLLDNVPIDTPTAGDRKYTIRDLFRSRHLIKVTCISALNWFVLGLVTYSIQFAIQAMSGSFYLNLFLLNVINIPTTFVAIALSNTIGRRKTAILCYALTACGALAVGIVQNIDTDMKGSVTNGLAMFTNLGIAIAWGPVQVMTLELYPTVVRNIGYGSMNMFARIGAIIGPQLAYLDTQKAGLMYFTCGVLSVGCTLGTIALKETKDATLQDKLQTSNRTNVNLSPEKPDSGQNDADPIRNTLM